MAIGEETRVSSKSRWKSVLGLVLMLFVGVPLALYGLLLLLMADAWGGPGWEIGGFLLLACGVVLVWQASRLI